MANRIRPIQKPAGEGLIYHRDLWRARPIVLIEISSREHRGEKRREVILAHVAERGIHFSLWVVIQPHVICSRVATERNNVRFGGCFNARDGFNPLQQLASKRKPAVSWKVQ